MLVSGQEIGMVTKGCAGMAAPSSIITVTFTGTAAFGAMVDVNLHGSGMTGVVSMCRIGADAI